MSRKTSQVSGGDTGTADQYNFVRDEARASSWLLAYSDTTTSTLKVLINESVVYFGGTKVEFGGGYSPVMSDPSASSRIDIVSMNATGEIVITVGTEADSPSAPTPPVDEMPICEVYHKAGEVKITDTDESAGEGYINKDLRIILEIPSTWRKIYDYTLTGNGRFDITGLDLDADSAYMIIMNLKLTTVGNNVDLFVNENYTATNYYVQTLIINHTTVTGLRANNAAIALTAGVPCFISGIMVREPGTGTPRFKGSIDYGPATGVTLGTFAWAFNSSANVTSLRISYAAAGIATGSRVMIFKIRRV